MKTLIAYFSWSGNTRRLVEEVNRSLGFDIVRIERKIPYSSDYSQCAYVEAKEEVEKGIHPEIRDLGIEPESYDRILLFFPIWWYTIPMPVATFVERNLSGYMGKVILFANSYTDDPQYMANSLRDLRKANPDLTIEEGLLNKSVSEHLTFIRNI